MDVLKTINVLVARDPLCTRDASFTKNVYETTLLTTDALDNINVSENMDALEQQGNSKSVRRYLRVGLVYTMDMIY